MERSYVDALEEGPEPHRVLFGPAPCIRCGAWVEWAGAGILNAGTRGEHQCAPFLYVADEYEVVAEWTRPASPRPVVMQAHPVPLLPRWVERLGTGILWLVVGLSAAFIVVQVAKHGNW